MNAIGTPFPVLPVSLPVSPSPPPPPSLLCLLLFLLLRLSFAGRLPFEEPRVLHQDQPLSLTLTDDLGLHRRDLDLDNDLRRRDFVLEDNDVIRSPIKSQITQEDSSLSSIQSTVGDLHLGNIDLEASDLKKHDLEEYYDLGTLQSGHSLSNDLEISHLDLRRSSNETRVHQNASLSNRTDIHAYSRQFTPLERMTPPRVTRDAVAKRHRNDVTRYRVFPGGFHDDDDDDRADVKEASVNLMIIPLGAIFAFIVLGLLHVSRWCIEDIREADGVLGKRRYTTTSGFIVPPSSVLSGSGSSSTRQSQLTSGSTTPRLSYSDLPDARLGGGGRSASTDLTRLHCRGGGIGGGGRSSRQARVLLPARSTRSLNGLRGDRNCERANRKQQLAAGSDSSIQMTDMTTLMTSSAAAAGGKYCRHGDRLRGGGGTDGGIVESCKRAVGSFLQSHLIVVPVDRNNMAGAAGTGSAAASGSRTRTRNYSSPASASSKTGSCCSENRPLLMAHGGSSSSDGRMTSSDSNIDVASPLSARRRLAAETRCRTKGAIAMTSSHGRHHNAAAGGGRGMATSVGYGHQLSAPAVSKLVHESLNLSFRFFHVPLSSQPSSSTSGQESLDSVFVCGIYADGGSDALLLRQPPEAELFYDQEMTSHGGGGGGCRGAGNPPRHPRSSREMLISAFCNSAYVRQGSVDDASKPEVPCPSSSSSRQQPDVVVQPASYDDDDDDDDGSGVHLAAKEGNAGEQVVYAGGATTLRRWTSASELQTRGGEASKRRAGKRNTT